MGFPENFSQIIGAVVTIVLIVAVAVYFALEYRADRLKWSEERKRKREERKNAIKSQLLQKQEEIGQKILQALSELAEEKNRLTDSNGYTIKVRRETSEPDIFDIRVGWGMQKEEGEIIFDEVIAVKINLREIPQIVMVYGSAKEECRAELGATEGELAFVIKNIGEHMQDFTPSPCKM